MTTERWLRVRLTRKHIRVRARELRGDAFLCRWNVDVELAVQDQSGHVTGHARAVRLPGWRRQPEIAVLAEVVSHGAERGAQLGQDTSDGRAITGAVLIALHDAPERVPRLQRTSAEKTLQGSGAVAATQLVDQQGQTPQRLGRAELTAQLQQEALAVEQHRRRRHISNRHVDGSCGELIEQRVEILLERRERAVTLGLRGAGRKNAFQHALIVQRVLRRPVVAMRRTAHDGGRIQRR